MTYIEESIRDDIYEALTKTVEGFYEEGHIGPMAEWSNDWDAEIWSIASEIAPVIRTRLEQMGVKE